MRSKRLLAIATALALSLIAPAAIAAQQQAGQTDPQAGAESQEAAQPEVAPPPSAAPPQPAAATPQPVTSARATASAAGTISIGDYFYRPSKVEAKVGQAVSWKNNGKVDEGHTVTGDGFDSGVLKQGDSYSHSFSQAGTYPYICTLHPNMKGRVVVVAAETGNDEGSNRGSEGSAGASGGSGGAASGEEQRRFANPESGSTASSSGGGGGGENRSLPASGSDSLLLALFGIVLLELGLAIRLGARQGWPRRGRG